MMLKVILVSGQKVLCSEIRGCDSPLTGHRYLELVTSDDDESIMDISPDNIQLVEVVEL
jgi:hypothetical protein